MHMEVGPPGASSQITLSKTIPDPNI
jgi:hypothetical protein